MKTALVMAGGTGGHIFPGLALAEALRSSGWNVCWLGGPNSMESRLVPAQGFEFRTIDFFGLRGKDTFTWLMLPIRLLKSFWQSVKIILDVKPDVVIGFGGYITFPAGLASVVFRKPLVLHEQNAVAGMVNKVLSKLATAVLTAFPSVLPKGVWVGNPLRTEFLLQRNPEERFSERTGQLELLVVGGSLGAVALNTLVPQAMALVEPKNRPRITHQSGEKHIEALRSAYAAAGIEAELTPFIEDTASAFARADLVICRAGASTVSEIAAVGAAAVFVPFPAAVDDHQTRNAMFLCNQGGGIYLAQKDITSHSLAELIGNIKRDTLLHYAIAAKSLEKTGATQSITKICEQLFLLKKIDRNVL